MARQVLPASKAMPDVRTLTARRARAGVTKDPDELRASTQALNAWKAEKALRDSLTAPHGLSAEDRDRLCALLHEGGAS